MKYMLFVIAAIAVLGACDRAGTADPAQTLRDRNAIEDRNNIIIITNAESIVGQWKLAQVGDLIVGSDDIPVIQISRKTIAAQINCRIVYFNFNFDNGRFVAEEAGQRNSEQANLVKPADHGTSVSKPQFTKLQADFIEAMTEANQVIQQSDGTLVIEGKGKSLSLHSFEDKAIS